jgi:hypothetical protein
MQRAFRLQFRVPSHVMTIDQVNLNLKMFSFSYRDCKIQDIRDSGIFLPTSVALHLTPPPNSSVICHY